MRKVLFMLALLPMLLLSACSDDEDPTSASVVGRWDVTWAQVGGESSDVPSGKVYMDLKSDGTYVTVIFDDYYKGTWTLNGNTVVGVTLDPVTEYYKFTSLKGNNAEIDYSNSDGLSMKFKATRR